MSRICLNFWQWIPGLRGSKRDPITARDLVEAARQKQWTGMVDVKTLAA